MMSEGGIPPTMSSWRYVLEHHGFGALIALILLLTLLGVIPSPLVTRLIAHTDRDQQRDAIILAVCLNLAKNDTQSEGRCWDALFGVGDIARLVDQARKRASTR